MTQNETNQQEWENRSNWKWGEFYHCQKDTRVWIPKKPKWMGWTLNFAKKPTYVWLLCIFGIPLALFLVFLEKV